MSLSRTSILKIIRWGLFSILLIVVISYATYRSANYFRGPIIEISYPEDGSSFILQAGTNMATTSISGKVIRAKDLYINGLLINIDEQGDFEEDFIIFPGINRFTIETKDQFDRTTKTALTLVGRTE